MAEKFAIQLVEDQQYLKAGMYFTLCGKLYEAIKMLTEKGRIVDALALAKTRLPEDDPVIETLYFKNARNFSNHKCIEAEAMCCLAAKQPSQAAKILYCASDPKYIWAAAYICKKFNLKEEGEMYAYFCLEKCLSQNEWPTFYEMVEHMENMKVYTTLVRVHELIQGPIKLLKKEGLVGTVFFGPKEPKTLIWSGKTFEDTNVPFLTNVFKVVHSEGILPTDKESLQAIHQALLTMKKNREKTEVAAEAHISVAICVTHIIVFSAMGEFDQAAKYFNKIFDASYHVVFLPKVICWIFLPVDIYWYKDEQKFIGSIKNEEPEQCPVTENFNKLYQSFCRKFSSIDFTSMKNYVFDTDISLNLDSTVQSVGHILSKKEAEESLLLFFLTSYVNELKRLVKRGWKFRCYESMKNIESGNTSPSSEQQLLSNAIKEALEILDIKFPSNSRENEINEKSSSGCSTETVEENSNNMVLKSLEAEKCQTPLTRNEVLQDDDIQISSLEKNGHILENSDLIENKDIISADKDDSQTTTDSDNITIIKENIKNGFTDFEGTVAEYEALRNIGDMEENFADKDQNKCKNKSLDTQNNGGERISDESANINTLEPGDNNAKTDKEKSKDELQASPDENDTHEMCLNNVDLFYGLIKSCASELCKDEYALIHYLTWRLDNVVLNISNLAHSLLHHHTEKPAASEESDTKINDISQNNSIEGTHEEGLAVIKKELESNAVMQTIEKSDENKLVPVRPEKDETSLIASTDNKTECSSAIMDCSSVPLSTDDSNGNGKELNSENISSKYESLISSNDECDKRIPSHDVGDIQSTKEVLNVSYSNTNKTSDKNLLNAKENDSQEKVKDVLNIVVPTTEETGENKMSNEFMSLKKDELVEFANALKDVPDSSLATVEDTKRENAREQIKVLEAYRTKLAEHLQFLKSKLNFQIVYPAIAQNCKDPANAAKERIRLLLGPNAQPQGPELTAPSTVHLLQDEETQIKEFYYPNPFEAVLDIIEICNQVFWKVPCSTVKEKFHSLAHDVLQWSSRFYVVEGTLSKCQICTNVFGECLKNTYLL